MDIGPTCLKDARRTYTFHMDDEVIDTFGPKIGAYGVALYALLARRAKENQCFPSYKHMMTKLNISRMTVIRTLQVLEKEGLITIQTRKARVGDYDTKLYTICNIESYHGGGTSQIPPGTSQIPPGTSQIPPGTSDRPGVVSQVDHGGISGRPPLEGFSLKGSQRKEEERPLSLPSGELPPPPHPPFFRPRAPLGPKPTKRCPVDYTPGKDLRDWAALRYPTVDFDECVEAMRDCEFSKGHQDWDATLRNWIRREAKDQARRASVTPISRAKQRAIDNHEAAIKAEEYIRATLGHSTVYAADGARGAGLQRRLPCG